MSSTTKPSLADVGGTLANQLWAAWPFHENYGQSVNGYGVGAAAMSPRSTNAPFNFASAASSTTSITRPRMTR